VPTIKKALQNRLTGTGKIAVLGIGSDLRGDDAAGMLATEKLAKLISKKRNSRIKVFLGSTAPENLTGEIKKFKPEHVIMIDAIEIKEKPGTILVLDPHEVGAGVSFSTHKLPAKILADYFSHFTKCAVTIIGIQPGSLDFGRKVSKDVASAANSIAGAIRDIVHPAKPSLSRRECRGRDSAKTTRQLKHQDRELHGK